MKQYDLGNNIYGYIVPIDAINPTSQWLSYPCMTNIIYESKGKKIYLTPVSKNRNFEDFSVIGFCNFKEGIELKEGEKILLIKENL